MEKTGALPKWLAKSVVSMVADVMTHAQVDLIHKHGGVVVEIHPAGHAPLHPWPDKHLVCQDSPHAIFTESGCPDALLSQGESKGGNTLSPVRFDFNNGQLRKPDPGSVFSKPEVPVDGASLLEVSVHQGHS